MADLFVRGLILCAFWLAGSGTYIHEPICTHLNDKRLVCKHQGADVYTARTTLDKIGSITFDFFDEASQFCVENVPNLRQLTIQNTLYRVDTPCELLRCCDQTSFCNATISVVIKIYIAVCITKNTSSRVTSDSVPPKAKMKNIL